MVEVVVVGQNCARPTTGTAARAPAITAILTGAGADLLCCFLRESWLHVADPVCFGAVLGLCRDDGRPPLVAQVLHDAVRERPPSIANWEIGSRPLSHLYSEEHIFLYYRLSETRASGQPEELDSRNI